MPNVRVKISKDGSNVQVGVEGVAGASCTDLTQSLEAAIMGGEVKKDLTDEYYTEPEISIEGNVG